TLIRVASICGVALTTLRALEEAIEGTRNPVLWAGLAFVIAGSLFLTVIAWSPQFERLYPRWSLFIVPARNAIIAAQVAAAAARGQTEMLIVMPITFIGPFFF